MIYIVVYHGSHFCYVVGAFYDEEIACAFAAQNGKEYTVECFMGARKIW